MTDKEKRCGQCEACEDPLFFLPGLPEDAGEELKKKMICRTLRKGSTIFQEGEKADVIYLIQKGRVKLTRWDADGNEQIIGIFADHELIWEGLLIEDSVYPYSAQCLTATRICTLHADDLMELLKEPSISLHVLTMLSQKLHDANERNLVLSTKDPKAKLAAFLLYRERRDQESSIQIKLDDISASLSLRPETVSRKLNELIDEGMVQRVGKSGICILDFEGLQAIIT